MFTRVYVKKGESWQSSPSNKLLSQIPEGLRTESSGALGLSFILLLSIISKFSGPPDKYRFSHLPSFSDQTYTRRSISAALSSSNSARRTSSKRASRSSARIRFFSAPLEILNNAAAVHHDEAVAKVGGLLHGMGHHQRRQLVAPDNGVGERNHLVGAFGIKRSRVLVEQQQLRAQPRCHEQSQRLPLSA